LLYRLLIAPALLALVAVRLLPTFPAFADTSFQPGQTVLVVGTDGRGLKVRAGPGMAHGILTTVAEGASLQIVAGPVSDGSDDWYQISASKAGTTSTTTGWAIGTYLVASTAVRSMSVDDAGSRVFLAKVTAYADGVGGVPVRARTYSGTKTRWGVVAVDPKVIPIGSAVRIEGYDDVIFIAEDVGGSIKGESLDIWLPDSAAAKTYGTQYRKITVLREGPDRSGGATVNLSTSTTPAAASSDSLLPLSAPILPSADPSAP
jgi:3D (Asp-Asp-Asp) domain-containing protein